MSPQQERIERERAARGERARAILEDPILVEAFGKVDAALVEAWRATPQRDTAGRERLHLATVLLGKVRSAIAEVATTGELSARTLRDIQRDPGAIARLVRR